MSDAASEFSAIYRRHASDVLRFALFLCGDRTEAEDIVSETFVRAWTTSSEIVADSVRAYLFTIARNLFVKRRRAAGRFVALPDGMADSTALASAIVEYQEQLDAVERRLAQLSQVDRAAFRMRVDGLSYTQIAGALGITEGAARVKVHRARAALGGIR